MSQTHYSKWNFDVLSSLIEGPLLNPKHLEEAMKGTRFGKRLMPFFWPRSRRFSTIDKTQVCNSIHCTQLCLALRWVSH